MYTHFSTGGCRFPPQLPVSTVNRFLSETNGSRHEPMWDLYTSLDSLTRGVHIYVVTTRRGKGEENIKTPFVRSFTCWGLMHCVMKDTDVTSGEGFVKGIKV